MKNSTLAACVIALAVPLSLLADTVTDRQIEDTAKASYNYRTTLGNDVKIKADDGVYSDGFKIIVQPAAIAGATLQAI